MNWRRLLHRWFVEYNPLYLLSAALVLRGVNVVSRELLHRGQAMAELVGPAVAEIYAWSLIGGAALLFRRGLRRPAVMLVLLAVLYQGDLTLHTETCAYLGAAGWIASGVWLASFVLKLVAMGRALELRISPSAHAVPIAGALGLIALPRVIEQASPHVASALVGAWLFGVLALALSTPRAITIASEDPWHLVVLRRSLAATWGIWGLLASLHVAFWFSMRPLEPSALLPVALVFVVRFVRRETFACAAVGSTIVFVGFAAPSFTALAAALGAIALGLVARTAKQRVPLVVGLSTCVWLAVWTAGWSGGAFPPHVVWLDAVLAGAMMGFVVQWRARSALLVLGSVLAEWSVQTRIVTAPVTALEWGVWSTGAGFALLAIAVGASVALRPDARRDVT